MSLSQGEADVVIIDRSRHVFCIPAGICGVARQHGFDNSSKRQLQGGRDRTDEEKSLLFLDLIGFVGATRPARASLFDRELSEAIRAEIGLVGNERSKDKVVTARSVRHTLPASLRTPPVLSPLLSYSSSASSSPLPPSSAAVSLLPPSLAAAAVDTNTTGSSKSLPDTSHESAPPSSGYLALFDPVAPASSSSSLFDGDAGPYYEWIAWRPFLLYRTVEHLLASDKASDPQVVRDIHSLREWTASMYNKVMSGLGIPRATGKDDSIRLCGSDAVICAETATSHSSRSGVDVDDGVWKYLRSSQSMYNRPPPSTSGLSNDGWAFTILDTTMPPSRMSRDEQHSLDSLHLSVGDSSSSSYTYSAVSSLKPGSSTRMAGIT